MVDKAQSIWETCGYLTKRGRGQRKEHDERREERERRNVKETKPIIRQGNE
jgi:hypothetical protein